MNKAILRKSQRLYGFLLQLYPKSYRQEYGREMLYVFSESLKDAYIQNGEPGVIRLWGRTIIDAGKSLVIQHIDNQKGNNPMKAKDSNIILQNKVFLWIALATGLILLIPLIAMQFTSEVNWVLFDFIVMGILLFGTGSMFVLTARKMDKKYRVAIGLAFTTGLLWLWAELAVGIFTNWGS